MNYVNKYPVTVSGLFIRRERVQPSFSQFVSLSASQYLEMLLNKPTTICIMYKQERQIIFYILSIFPQDIPHDIPYTKAI